MTGGLAMFETLPASKIIVGIGIAGTYALIFLGWGDLIRRALKLPCGRMAFDTALGMASVVFVGSILNLARAAVPAALVLVALVGVVIGASRIVNEIAEWRRRKSVAVAPTTVVSAVAVTGVAAFSAITVIPPSALHYIDDLKKYLAYPVRMLETGTLYGSPLNALGAETLGGQAFLQAFSLAVLPLPYVGAFDNLFCVLLCVALAGSLAGRKSAYTPAATVAVLAVVVIEPQNANLSALYSGAVLVMALFALLADPASLQQTPPAKQALMTGFIIAAMIALKPTLAFIGAVMLASAAIGITVGTKDFRKAIRWGVVASSATLAGLSSWLALYAPYLITAIRSPVPLPKPPVADQLATESFSLLSLEPLPYGGSGMAFAVVLSMALVAGLVAVMGFRRQTNTQRIGSATLFASVVGAFAGLVMLVVVLAPYLHGYFIMLRYYTPVVIGVVPAAIALGSVYLERGPIRSVTRMHRLTYAAIAAAAVALFAPAFAHRVLHMFEHGNPIMIWGIGVRPENIQYSSLALSPESVALVRKIQSIVPAGEPILAWTTTPFALDYRRNPIYDVTVAGLAAPWAEVPRVAYVIWQYRGYAVATRERLQGATSQPGRRLLTAVEFRALQFLRLVEHEAWTGTPLYNDGFTLVFRVEGGFPQKWRW